MAASTIMSIARNQAATEAKPKTGNFFSRTKVRFAHGLFGIVYHVAVGPAEARDANAHELAYFHAMGTGAIRCDKPIPLPEDILVPLSRMHFAATFLTAKWLACFLHSHGNEFRRVVVAVTIPSHSDGTSLIMEGSLGGTRACVFGRANQVRAGFKRAGTEEARRFSDEKAGGARRVRHATGKALHGVMVQRGGAMRVRTHQPPPPPEELSS